MEKSTHFHPNEIWYGRARILNICDYEELKECSSQQPYASESNRSPGIRRASIITTPLYKKDIQFLRNLNNLVLHEFLLIS